MSVDLLAIGAHPDDVEIGCGGVMALAADAGLRVVAVDLTAGELGTRGTREGRAREAERAAELLGLADRICLGLPDTRLGTDPCHREELAAVIRRLAPRVVLAPWVQDRHPDHAAAGEMAREACYLAGLANVGTGSPHRPSRLYHFPLHEPAEPSLVVDVSSVWERRMAAVRAFESQFVAAGEEPRTELSTPRFVELVEHRASVYGAMIGVARGEAFCCRGPVPLALIPGLLEGPRPAYRSYT